MLTVEIARELAAAVTASAVAQQCTVSIAILDAGAHLICFERMNGALLGSIATSQAKARSAVLFRRPTKAFEDQLVAGRMAILNLPDAIPLDGGVPLFHGDELIGAVGVSGGSAQQDGVAALAASQAFDLLISEKVL